MTKRVIEFIITEVSIVVFVMISLLSTSVAFNLDKEEREKERIASVSRANTVLGISLYLNEIEHDKKYLKRKSLIKPYEKDILSFMKYINHVYPYASKKRDPYNTTKIGYLKENTNVYSSPNKEAIIIDQLRWNCDVYYNYYNEEWTIVRINNHYGWIKNNLIMEKKYTYDSYKVYGDRRKSYMDWRAITNRNSPQYDLQVNYATDSASGVRMADGRYLIAIGSFYTNRIGQYVDIVLSNGIILECMTGDAKANVHTKDGNRLGLDGGAVEFIVSTSLLSPAVKQTGNLSSYENWNANVIEIRVYNKNIFTS